VFLTIYIKASQVKLIVTRRNNGGVRMRIHSIEKYYKMIERRENDENPDDKPNV